MDALVRTYLDRIGLRGPVKADLDTLRAVQRRALETIPFENLDILRGIPLRFGTEELADKVLTRRRGGVCYEQNFLLEEVLRRLGMDTALLSGYVIGGSQLAFSHALVLVRLPEGRYIADVGFGGRGTALTPLALDTGEWQSDGRSRFRLRREGGGTCWSGRRGMGRPPGSTIFPTSPAAGRSSGRPATRFAPPRSANSPTCWCATGNPPRGCWPSGTGPSAWSAPAALRRSPR